jgi:hypothetical protein
LGAEIAANDSQGQKHCIPFLSFGAILKFNGGFDNAVVDFEKLKSLGRLFVPPMIRVSQRTSGRIWCVMHVMIIVLLDKK